MPREGEQHPQFSECWWSNRLGTYACSDGSTSDGNPLPDDWSWADFGPIDVGVLGTVNVYADNSAQRTESGGSAALSTGGRVIGSTFGDPAQRTADEEIKARARAGDTTALNQLAASGNFAAKLAISLGVKLATAETIAIGGIALLAVVVTGIVTKR